MKKFLLPPVFEPITSDLLHEPYLTKPNGGQPILRDFSVSFKEYI